MSLVSILKPSTEAAPDEGSKVEAGITIEVCLLGIILVASATSLSSTNQIYCHIYQLPIPPCSLVRRFPGEDIAIIIFVDINATMRHVTARNARRLRVCQWWNGSEQNLLHLPVLLGAVELAVRGVPLSLRWLLHHHCRQIPAVSDRLGIAILQPLCPRRVPDGSHEGPEPTPERR